MLLDLPHFNTVSKTLLVGCYLWGKARIWLLFMGEDSTCDTRPLNICVVVHLQCVTHLLIRKYIFINSSLHFGHTFS